MEEKQNTGTDRFRRYCAGIGYHGCRWDYRHEGNIINFNGAAPNVGWKIILAIILLVITALTSYLRWEVRQVV
ncbi:MAG: hypothetical protein MUO77_04460 [Anaerolineales bacterium]|nr:hypothetical protein [Anaerolineales bacterium]